MVVHSMILVTTRAKAGANEGNNIPGSPEPGLGGPEGCKIVAGGRRPPEHDPFDRQHPERVRDITLPLAQELAPLQGANRLTRARRSSLRFDLRLLSDNPPGCKYICFISIGQAYHS